MKVGFIGLGNMGSAIARGYAAKASAEQKQKLFLFDKSKDKMNDIAGCTGGKALESIDEIVEKTEIIFVGVKPVNFEEVLHEIAKKYNGNQIIVSMAAGISINRIKNKLNSQAKIVRIMPNTPAQIGEGMTALCKSENVSEDEESSVIEILEKIGKVGKINEELIHTVIGASGSSPAYVYLFIESLINAAVENGMDYEQAKIFVSQSVKGSAEMVMKSEKNPKILRENVCSPNGTTIEAVEYLINNNFEKIMSEAFKSAMEKSKMMEE